MGLNDLLTEQGQSLELNTLIEPAPQGFERQMEVPLEPVPEVRARVNERKESLFVRGLRFLGGAFEPLMLPGDALRAAIYDIFYRSPDSESELARVWSNLLRYAPWGKRPDDIVSFREILRDRYGVEGAEATIFGTVLDIATDPAVLVAGWGKAANIAARAAAKDAAKLGIDVGSIRASDLERIVSRMEPGPIKEQLEVALRIKRGPALLTPAGFVEAVFPESVRASLQRAVIDLADSTPILKRLRQKKVVEGTPRYTKEEAPDILEEGIAEEPLGKALLPESIYWTIKTAGTPHEEAARRVHGLYDVFSPGRPDITPGLKNEADFLAKRIRLIGEAATADLHNTIRQTLGVSPKEMPHFYREFDVALGRLIDRLGPGDAVRLVNALKETHSLDEVLELLPKEVNTELFKEVSGNLKRLARAYDIPEERIEEALLRGIRVAWAAHAITGYYLSGMYKLDELITRVLPDVQKLAGLEDIKQARALVDQITAKVGMGKALTPDELRVFELINQEWKKLGYMDTFAVRPADFIKSIYRGYLRRIVPLKDWNSKDFLDSVADALEQGSQFFVAKSLNSERLVEAIRREFGEQAAERMAAHLAVRGSGAISTAELADIAGIPEKRLLKLLSDIGATPIELDDKVIDALSKFYAREDGFLKQRPVAAMEIGFQKWRERKLPEAKLVADFLGLAGATERMEAYSRAAARTIKAERFVAESYDMLSRLGLISDGLGLRVVRGKPVDEFGVEYWRVPYHPDLWGPLAGKYVPRYVAEPMLRALELDEPKLWQEALQSWRAMTLSSPRTVVANIGGGINALMRLGMDPVSVVRYMRNAYKDLAEVKAGRAAKALGPGWDKLNLYAKGKLYGEAVDEFDRVMIKVLNEGRPEGLIGKLGQLQRTLATHPASPLLWFERSEDAMRLAYFKWMRDRLVGAGVPMEKAAELAAANANAALFNYAEQPFLMNLAKRYGLLLFPAFAYYNLSRTARMLAEAPAAGAIPAHIYQAIVDASLGPDEEERLRWKMMVYGTWMENAAPVPLKIGEAVYAIPMAQFFPESATEPTSIVEELATGGIARPLVSSFWALFTGETPPWERRFGKQYTSPADYTFLDRLVSVGRQAAYDILPTPGKQIARLVGALKRQVLDYEDDAFFALYGREFAPSVSEALANFVVGLRKLDAQYGQRSRRFKAVECVRRFRAAVYEAKRLDTAGEREKAMRLVERAVAERAKCLEGVWR